MNARQQAEARLQEAGPFIIERASRNRPTSWATRTGWTNDRDKAHRIDTREQAKFFLRGRGGEIVPANEEPADPPPKSKVHDLVPVPADGLQKLTSSERQEFVQCEATIEKGMTDVGLALLRIREGRLYKEQFHAWEDYIQARWNFSGRQAHRLCDQAQVHRNLLSAGDAGNGAGGQLTKLVSLPKESQTRHLARLKPEEQPKAWKEAQESANGGRVTAKHVETAVQKRLPARVVRQGNRSTIVDLRTRSKWPQPDQEGYYTGEMTQSECFSQKNVWIKIGAIQVGEAQWAVGFQFIAKEGSPIGVLNAMRTPNKSWLSATPASALKDACSMLTAEISPLQRTVITRAAKTLLQDIIDWTHHFSPVEKFGNDGPWVVCRPPLEGATSPSAMVARYSGPGWGWSPNPEKGKPYRSWHEANTEAQRHGDRVVALRDVIQKGQVQVKAHERRAAKQTWDEVPTAADEPDASNDDIASGIREAMAYLGALDDNLGRELDSQMQGKVQRCLVLLRPVLKKYTASDNMRAERLDSQQNDNPFARARFCALDAHVDAHAALDLLRMAGSDLRLELEQAQCAVDALARLKDLLDRPRQSANGTSRR